MASIRLKSLRLKAFRSFSNEAEVTFPESGLVLIDGKNLDTGGSSGSGKSSLNLALAYAFGYCPFPATQLQSWLTEDPMSVEVVFDTAEGECVITRGEKLKLKVGGKTIKGSAVAVESKLRELTGLSPEMLAALTYRAQQERGLFLNKTDSEKKEFLTALLGLSKYEDAVEAAQAKVKELEPKLSVLLGKGSTLMDRRKVLESTRPAMYTDSLGVDHTVRIHEIQNHLNLVVKTNVNQCNLALRNLATQEKHDLSVAEATNATEIDSLLRDISLLRDNSPVVDDSELTRLKGLMLNVQERLTKLEDQRLIQKQENLAQRRGLEKQLRVCIQARDSVPGMEAEKATLIAQISELQKSKCYTCAQPWRKAEAEIEAVQFKINALVHKTDTALELAGQIPGLESKIVAFEDVPEAPMVAQLRSIQSKLDSDYAVALSNIKNGQELHAAKLREQELVLEAQIAVLKEARTKAVNDVKTATATTQTRLDAEKAKWVAQVAQYEAEMVRLRLESNLHKSEQARIMQAWNYWNNEFEQVNTDLKNTATEAAELDAKVKAEQDFAKLVGREGFLGAIFDEVLEEISADANRILGALPNTSHVTVRFQSESFTQKGTVKRAIVPVITIGGHEAPLASGCSGGMATSVELAVDLAVAAVVSRRTGSVPGWLILDEAFEGLDLITKESCMAILSTYASDKLVLVVDHASEFKEAFTQFVTVSLTNGKSTL